MGSVSGIGLALFAYARMLCGADALKPDNRVRSELAALGFPVHNDPHSILVIATAAASEIGFRMIELDQLLWRARS